MRRKNKLSAILIIPKNKDTKNNLIEIFRNYKGFIITGFLIWSISFFVLPYFAYYKFVPIDFYLIDSNIIFILLAVVAIFLIFFLSPIFALYLSFQIFLPLKDNISLKKIFFYVLGMNFGFSFLFFIGAYKNDKNIILSFEVASLMFLVFFFVELFYMLFLLMLNKEITKSSTYLRKTRNWYIFLEILSSYVFFLIFLALLVFIIYISLSEPKDYLSGLVIFILYIIIASAIFISIINNDRILFGGAIGILFMVPFIFMYFSFKGYIKILYNLYSNFGLASSKNIILIKKDIYNTLPQDISRRLSMCRSIKLKNKNYVCLEDVKIIWNGNKKIFISVEDKLTLPINRSALLNGDFIRKRKHTLSEKKKNKNKNTSY